jgi:hypothetical protein
VQNEMQSSNRLFEARVGEFRILTCLEHGADVPSPQRLAFRFEGYPAE